MRRCTKAVHCRGYCHMHYQRWRKWGDPNCVHQHDYGTDESRFWQKVDKNGPQPGADTLAAGMDRCWIWKGHVGSKGYGKAWAKKRGWKAHVFSYFVTVGRVPKGKELDHLCELRACVNPGHLEPVTHTENMRRGRWGKATHCIWGHEYTPENTGIGTSRGRPQRYCKICLQERQARKKAA